MCWKRSTQYHKPFSDPTVQLHVYMYPSIAMQLPFPYKQCMKTDLSPHNMVGCKPAQRVLCSAHIKPLHVHQRLVAERELTGGCGLANVPHNARGAGVD